MTARLHRSSGFRPGGLPLILTRATTGVATNISAADTWTAVDIGTFTEAVAVHPDWSATDIAGTDHKIEPRWPIGIERLPVRVNFYSAACGTSHTAAEDFVIALFDIQDNATPGDDAELLFAQLLEDCPAAQTGDTLELDFVCNVHRDAGLRFYVMNLDGAHNFEIDPLRLSFAII